MDIVIDNLGNIIVGGGIIFLVFKIIRGFIKNKGKCGSCPYSGSCQVSKSKGDCTSPENEISK